MHLAFHFIQKNWREMTRDKIQTINHMEHSLFARSLIFGNHFAKKVQKAACTCSLHRKATKKTKQAY